MLRKVARGLQLSLLLGSLYTLKFDGSGTVRHFLVTCKPFVFNRLSLKLQDSTENVRVWGFLGPPDTVPRTRKKGTASRFPHSTALNTKQFGERKSVAVPLFRGGSPLFSPAHTSMTRESSASKRLTAP